VNKGDQIIKCRDDKAPVLFSRTADTEDSFKLAPKTDCSWQTKDQTFDSRKLRQRIEPWLTAVFQSDHLALLVGSGLPDAIHSIATGNALPGMNPVNFAKFDTEITPNTNKIIVVLRFQS